MIELTEHEIEILVDHYAERLKTLCSGVDSSNDRRKWAAERLSRLHELLEHYSTLQDR